MKWTFIIDGTTSVEKLWPKPECDPTTFDLVANRRDFTVLLNEAVGVPDAAGLAFQACFIAGQLTYDEMVSYVRLSKYKIFATTTLDAYSV